MMTKPTVFLATTKKFRRTSSNDKKFVEHGFFVDNEFAFTKDIPKQILSNNSSRFLFRIVEPFFVYLNRWFNTCHQILGKHVLYIGTFDRAIQSNEFNLD